MIRRPWLLPCLPVDLLHFLKANWDCGWSLGTTSPESNQAAKWRLNLTQVVNPFENTIRWMLECSRQNPRISFGVSSIIFWSSDPFRRQLWTTSHKANPLEHSISTCFSYGKISVYRRSEAIAYGFPVQVEIQLARRNPRQSPAIHQKALQTKAQTVSEDDDLSTTSFQYIPRTRQKWTQNALHGKTIILLLLQGPHGWMGSQNQSVNFDILVSKRWKRTRPHGIKGFGGHYILTFGGLASFARGRRDGLPSPWRFLSIRSCSGRSDKAFPIQRNWWFDCFHIRAFCRCSRSPRPVQAKKFEFFLQSTKPCFESNGGVALTESSWVRGCVEECVGLSPPKSRLHRMADDIFRRCGRSESERQNTACKQVLIQKVS